MSAAGAVPVDVLIPTCNRPSALAVTLACVAAQAGPLRVVVADQSDTPAWEHPVVLAVVRVLQARGIAPQLHRRLPRRGMAEQRAFLLAQVQAPSCLFLDDDVIIERDLLARLLAALQAQQCGFVGSALHGLSFINDVRPSQQAIRFWDGPVAPEVVTPDSDAWARHHLHSAANLFHVQQRTARAPDRLYRVAWVGGCVLFDSAKLRAAGGFDFWPSLPAAHSGEDVLAQLRVMARDGGAALFPSGAYHMELPTTVPQRDVDAARLLLPQFLQPLRERA